MPNLPFASTARPTANGDTAELPSSATITSSGIAPHRTSQAPHDGSQQVIPRWRPVDALMGELGHESLAVTQICLADMKIEEMKKAVADADFVPKPRLVSGTNGD